MTEKEELLQEMARCVLEMEDELVVDVAKRYAEKGYDPAEGILTGLVSGMNQAAELYEKEEYFIPELLICSSAMYNALDVLRPLMPKEENGVKRKVVIGVVEGDTHDIGKNLVKVMSEPVKREMEDLAGKLEYLELSEYAPYNKVFVDCLKFPERAAAESERK